ncbi:MAG TPA: M20/M25/M40 family metallo-hydrolase [Thermoleophilaceae bacterium]|nr:M20/M25/M40 family metallo-hydrolase [Thermoleophilaceae bacterium]
MRAAPDERERLAGDFVRLCAIESPSGNERAVADAVAAELTACGLEVEEDGSAEATGSNAGNLLARIPGPADAPTVLLCAHLDTVPLTAPIEVVRESGRFANRNEGILGADNKATVAVLLAIARRFAAGGAPVGIELLFTTCEELALLGAKELGHELRADFGFVLDHATPIGELIVAAPSYYRIEAHFHGAAAHAGIRPESGRNAIAVAAKAIAAMRLGRLDPETTANVGTIVGGTATNVVAERCDVALEVRSLDDDRAGAVVAEIVDALTEAASDGECDVETTVEQLFRAYRLPRTAAPVQAAATALEALGIEPSFVPTGGGSDANVFVARGLPVLNVANGTERNHEPGESVTVEALELALDVALGIVDAAGRAVAAPRSPAAMGEDPGSGDGGPAGGEPAP